MSMVYELGEQGVQAHPKNFWFVNNLGKTSKKFGTEILTFLTIMKFF